MNRIFVDDYLHKHNKTIFKKRPTKAMESLLITTMLNDKGHNVKPSNSLEYGGNNLKLLHNLHFENNNSFAFIIKALIKH